MSIAGTILAAGQAAGAAPDAKGVRRQRLQRMAIAAALGFLLLSLVRQIDGAADLTSSGTMGAALRLSIPIGLAALGGLWAERAGVVNIGLEGMMVLGTWFGAWAGYQWGPWWGVLAGVLGGAAGGLLHAIATIGFGVDHIVSGVAINILGPGIARFLSVVAYKNGANGGGATQSPSINSNIQTLTVPILSGGKVFGWQSPDALGSIERHHWFAVSDLAGVLGGLTSNVSLLTVIAVLLVPLSFFVLWRTAFGLRLRSCGEAPVAAESLGVKVYRMKFTGVLISGAFAGLAGAFLVTVASNLYREGQTGGRGYIGLAALIFGNWRPGGLAAGAGLFGYSDALQLRSPVGVHALLLFAGLILAALTVRSVLRKKFRGGTFAALGAAGFLVWYGLSDIVPTDLVGATPYVVTLLVLALAAQRLRPPAADGQPYRRGQAQ